MKKWITYFSVLNWKIIKMRTKMVADVSDNSLSENEEDKTFFDDLTEIESLIISY